MNQKRKAGLIGIFVLFMLLLNVPFISIPTGSVGNIPNLMIYFGFVWIVLIALMGIIFNQKNSRP